MKTKDAFGITGGLFASMIVCLSQPAFLFEPQSKSVSGGANVLFQGIAFGVGQIGYQWFKDGVALAGETSDFLFLTGVTLSSAGDYFLVASNFSGSATSVVATLNVDGMFTKVTSEPLVRDPGSSFPAAWGDYDNDGFVDVFVPKGATDFNYLYHNNGDGTFTRILSGTIVTDYGNTRAAIWADFNNDSLLDLLAVNAGLGQGLSVGTNWLYLSDGNGDFSRSNVGTFEQSPGDNSSAAWGDFDRDGFLDLCIGTDTSANFLFRNDGSGGLTRITAGSVAADNFKATASVLWTDLNGDKAPDLVVINQPMPSPVGNFRLGEEIIYTNTGFGTFVRVTNAITAAGGNSVSGASVDYDSDGDLDVCVVNSGGHSSLFQNQGGGVFRAITTGNPLTDGSGGTNSSGCSWADFDNDGWIDVFITNESGLNNLLYRNHGNGIFNRIGVGSPVNDGGNSSGSTWVDINRDGFLDLYVSNLSGENFLYRNNGNSNSWIDIKLVGEVSNRSGIGAKVHLLANIGGTSRWQLRELAARDGSSSPNAHFGLGDATSIQAIRIEWPSGIVHELLEVCVNQFLTVVEPPSIRILPAFQTEGDQGQRSILFSLLLTRPTNSFVAVDFMTQDLTAEGGFDYIPTNGTVIFGPNETNQIVAVTIMGDVADEANETFLITLTNSSALYPEKPAVGTIIDDDPLTMRVGSPLAVEGNTSTNSAHFSIELSKSVSFGVSVDFATTSGTALAGIDFVATNGTVQFAAGEIFKTISIPIIGDLLHEANEIFFLDLTNVVNAFVVNSRGAALILNDDPPPSVSVGHIEVMEGDSGFKQVLIDVRLSSASVSNITVQFATSNLTAIVLQDFLFASGTLTFPPGVTNRTIGVTIVGDTNVEPPEAFFVNLFNPIRSTVGSLGTCTIIDDDFNLEQVSLSDSGFSFMFPTTLGRHYRVEWTEALSTTSAWSTVVGYEGILGDGTFASVIDDDFESKPQRFYRVLLLPP